MKKLKESLFFLFLFLAVCAAATYADAWPAPQKTTFFSQKRLSQLTIEPHPDWPTKPGHCRATLSHGEREIWTRQLINDHAPVRVFVSDSGRYVITMDEWHNVGKLPVAIYGPRGELISVHSTASLGLKEDVHQIKRTTSSYWWNENSIAFFGPNDDTFFIRLHWGKIIILDLSNGALMNDEWFASSKGWLISEEKWKALRDFGDSQVKLRATEFLNSGDSEERTTGAIVCGQSKVIECVPRLKELLLDPEYHTTNVPKEWTRVYIVRKAAKEALEALGQKVNNVVLDEIAPRD